MIYNGLDRTNGRKDKGRRGDNKVDKMKPDYITDEKPEEYWARQIDPSNIRSKNWSRRTKRNKKLWSPFPKRRYGAGAGKTASVNRAAELRERLG